MQILLHNKQKRRIPRRMLERVGEAVMTAEGCHPETELSVVIGDDAWIQELNRTYLKKNRPTDVMAFPQDPGPEGTPLLGDVAISAEAAARQAEEMSHSFAWEMTLLLAHGILHLTGWRDDTPERRTKMLARAEAILAQVFPASCQ